MARKSQKRPLNVVPKAQFLWPIQRWVPSFQKVSNPRDRAGPIIKRKVWRITPIAPAKLGFKSWLQSWNKR